MLKINTESYIQCTHCGKIYNVIGSVKIENDLYVNYTCPKCGHKRGLYLGEDINSLYELYDAHLDRRYYIYK